MQITIFGYGSQGRAQALNLRDSGFKIRAFLRPESARIAQAKTDGIDVVSDPVAAAKEATIALLLLPDTEQPAFYETILKPHLPKKAALVFAHGFNIHYEQITPRPDIDILLVAPAIQGDGLRDNYSKKERVPILTAVGQDFSESAYRLVEDLARAMGGDKTYLIPTTFKEETETDLFCEQAVLCGGLFTLIQTGFETLVAQGYNPKIAYFSCLKELKAIADNLYKHGLAAMTSRISSTALFGAVTRGPRIINTESQENMKTLLGEVLSGKFKEELLEEKNKNWPQTTKYKTKANQHLLESVRKDIDNP